MPLLAPLTAGAFALILLAQPWAGVAILTANAIAAALSHALPLLALYRGDPARRAAHFDDGAAPFVSLHILVRPDQRPHARAAISAALCSEYPAFEVIVLMMTAGEEEAVEETPNPPARVIRFDKGVGAAEVLNSGLSEMNWQAQCVAVVEGDFAPSEGFLRLAVDHLRRDDVSFVQFPAPLRRVDALEAGLDLERADFLGQVARATRSVLQIGAVATVVSVQALREVGGWRTSAFLVDSELGTRFLEAGLRGLFVDAPVGKGLSSPRFPALRLQRAEWLRGATQTLRDRWPTVLNLQRAGASANLATGQSYWLVPAATIAVGGVVSAIAPHTGLNLALAIAAWTILASFLAEAVRLAARGLAMRGLAMRGLAGRVALRGIAVAIAIRLALEWTASTAWMDQRPAPIEAASLARMDLLALFAGAMGFAAALLNGRPEVAAASALLMGCWCAGQWAQAALSGARLRSAV